MMNAMESAADRLLPYALGAGTLLNVLVLCMQFMLTGEAEPVQSDLTVLLVGYTWWALATDAFKR